MFFGLRTYLKLAARLGIEPRLEASKAPVLPLDDLAIFNYKNILTRKSWIDKR